MEIMNEETQPVVKEMSENSLPFRSRKTGNYILIYICNFPRPWTSFCFCYARSDPRNHFSVQKKMFSCHLLNFSVFHHVFISSLDMFENCINSYHIDSEQVQTCLRIIWIITIRIILNLNKFRHVTTCSDMFENHINSYQIDSEQV